MWLWRVPPSATAGAGADTAVWRARALRAEALAGQLIAEKAALNDQVAGLAAQVEQLTQTVATLTGILFGDSSEKKKPPRQPDGRDGNDGGDGVHGRGPGRRKRGQRTGAPGHGRRPYAHLETEEHSWMWIRTCGGAAAAAPVTSTWAPRTLSRSTGG
jgi:hypothetical protein